MNIKEYLDYIGDDWAKGWLLRGDANRNGVFVPFIFIDLCEGNLYEAVILAQAMYWADVDTSKGAPRLSHRHGDHFWIVKTYEEWAKELHLNSWTTVRDAIKRLSDKGFLIKETHKSIFHGGGTALFLRPNWKVFGEEIRELANTSRNMDDDILGNTSDITPYRNTSDVISENTSDGIPENTHHVNPIYTENTPENTPALASDDALAGARTSSFAPADKEHTKTTIEIRVHEALAALAIAKIRFPRGKFAKREELIEEAIQEYGFRTVKKAIHQSQKEKARWWSYVDTKLRAEQPASDAPTGEDFITGKYAYLIEH